MSLIQLEKILLFLTVLFLPTQLGRHFWPEFTLVYSLPIDYLSPTLYFWDLLVILLLGVFLLGRQYINKTALNLFLFFYFSQLISLLPALFGYNLNLGAGLVRLEQYLVTGLFSVYLASKNLEKIRLTLFVALLLGVLLESLLAFGQFLSSSSIGFWVLGERDFTISTPTIAKFDFQGLQLLRPYATFPHPNTMAGYMAVVLPLLVFLHQGLIKDKFFDLGLRLATVISGLAVLITVARVGLLAWLIAALTILQKRSRLILGGIILLFSPFLYIRFSSLFNFDFLTVLRREELMEVALNMFFTSPLFGVGLNNFIPKAADLLLVGPSRFLQPVHNIFLLSLSETGIIGFAGLALLLGVPIYLLIKNGYKTNSLILTTLCLILFLGLFDHYFLTLPQGYRLLFLVWGLTFSLKSNH